MANTIKDKAADAGHFVGDTAKKVGDKIAETTQNAVDKVEHVSPPMPRGKHEPCTEGKSDQAIDKVTQVSPPMPRGKPGRSNDELCCMEGTNVGIAGIKEHMDVIASCGKKVGVVDHLEGNAIKLTKKDSPDGQHHFLPVESVKCVDTHVHLTMNSQEAEQSWKSDAASCGCGG